MKKIFLIPVALLILCCCSNEGELNVQVDDDIDSLSVYSPERDPNYPMEDAYWSKSDGCWIHCWYDSLYFDEQGNPYDIDENGDTTYLK